MATAEPSAPLPSHRGRDGLPGRPLSLQPKSTTGEAKADSSSAERGTPGQGNLSRTPCRAVDGGQKDELAAELSPAFPAVPGGAVTRHSVYSPTWREQWDVNGSSFHHTLAASCCRAASPAMLALLLLYSGRCSASHHSEV